MVLQLHLSQKLQSNGSRHELLKYQLENGGGGGAKKENKNKLKIWRQEKREGGGGGGGDPIKQLQPNLRFG